jgi:transposase
MPVRIFITDGTTADCTKAAELFENIEIANLFADKAYDTDAILAYCQIHEVKPVIPPKTNRKLKREFDSDLYKLRHLVENAFLHLKRWRGVATRYAKNADSFLAAAQ